MSEYEHARCELCDYPVRGTYFSVPWANDWGVGVCLHQRCSVRLERLARAIGKYEACGVLRTMHATEHRGGNIGVSGTVDSETGAGVDVLARRLTEKLGRAGQLPSKAQAEFDARERS